MTTAWWPGQGMRNRFGNPVVIIPKRVASPSCPFRRDGPFAAADDLVPEAAGERGHLGLEAGGVDDAVQLVLVPVDHHAPLGTRSIPAGQSTMVTFDRFNAGRYSSWKSGRRQLYR